MRPATLIVIVLIMGGLMALLGLTANLAGSTREKANEKEKSFKEQSELQEAELLRLRSQLQDQARVFAGARLVFERERAADQALIARLSASLAMAVHVAQIIPASASQAGSATHSVSATTPSEPVPERF